jgi:hypothetical protein
MSDSLHFDGLDLKRVEEVGLNGLQTQRQLFYDGWLLRVSPGKAKRARSVNPCFGSTLPLARKIPYCERLYAERGLPVLFRITPFISPPDLEAELATRGYEAFQTTMVQLTRLDHPPPTPALNGVDLMTPTLATFAEAVGELQQTTAEQRAAYLERMTHAPLPTRNVLAVVDGGPSARARSCSRMVWPACSPWAPRRMCGPRHRHRYPRHHVALGVGTRRNTRLPAGRC